MDIENGDNRWFSRRPEEGEEAQWLKESSQPNRKFKFQARQGRKCKMHKGSCNCGAVSFTVEGDLAPPDACHCSQCRKQSGHYWASTDVPDDRITIHGEDNITWYQASEKVRRGFCKTCGCFLFWDPIHHPRIAVAMGAFDGATGAKLGSHIYVADKGGYYEIADGLPQNEQ